MDINNFNKKFNSAINVLEKFNEAGYEAYFVGGCVRDYLLNDEFSDIDITTNALPDEVKQIFKKSIDTGIQHGTVTILVNGDSFEVTTSMTGQVKLIRWLSKQSGTCYCIDIDKDNELNESLGYKYKDIYTKLIEKSFKQLLSRIDEIVV